MKSKSVIGIMIAVCTALILCFAVPAMAAQDSPAGAAASIMPPLSAHVFLSNNGVDFVNVGQLNMASNPTASFWAELVNAGYAARYVKFEVAPSGNTTWVFLNELEVYGRELSVGENVALTTGTEHRRKIERLGLVV